MGTYETVRKVKPLNRQTEALVGPKRWPLPKGKKGASPSGDLSSLVNQMDLPSGGPSPQADRRDIPSGGTCPKANRKDFPSGGPLERLDLRLPVPAG